MIRYRRGGCCYFLSKLCLSCSGSVFPKSLLVALPCAFVTAGLTHMRNIGVELVVNLLKDEAVLRDNAAWGGFSFLVGFLIVFRTSQSYNRFWDGCTFTHRVRAEWFDACSSLLAFCRHKDDQSKSMKSFQNRLVRLFSMLHAAALAEIEDSCTDDHESVEAFKYELLDAQGLDRASLQFVRDSSAKVELIFQWIQQLIVQNVSNGVLSIPPPLLSRSFQELSNGMVAFHEALKISVIPFPFPYAQSCDLLLLMHMLGTPFVICQWVPEPYWAGAFAFTQVFILWSLNFIALELENPFGVDPNDIDGHSMQMEMNEQLLLLLQPGTLQVPELSDDCIDLLNATQVLVPRHTKSFHQIWHELPEGSQTVARRYTHPKQSICTIGSYDVNQQSQTNRQTDLESGSLGRNAQFQLRKTASLASVVSSWTDDTKFRAEESDADYSDDPETGKMHARDRLKEVTRARAFDLRPNAVVQHSPGTQASPDDLRPVASIPELPGTPQSEPHKSASARLPTNSVPFSREALSIA